MKQPGSYRSCPLENEELPFFSKFRAGEFRRSGYLRSGFWPGAFRADQLWWRGLLILCIGLILSSCDPLRPKAPVTDTEFSLINQENETVVFPNAYEGKIVLISYVYTYCPDICPMITYNMRDVQRAFPQEDRLMLVSVSFDPERDTPVILKKYAGSYKLDLEHWDMLTGDPRVVNQLLDATEIRTLKTPTTFLEGGEAFYFIDHTDKISLIDAGGVLRRNYSGSELDIDQVVQDIRTLLGET